MDQPGKVANPARGQLNRGKNIPLSPCVPENLVSRDGFSRPFPLSTVNSSFVYPRNNRFPLVGHDVRKNPSSCDCAEIRTHVPTSQGFEITN